MTERKSNRLSDIQILRALACLMVIFQHLSLTPTLLKQVPGSLTMPFYLGVELFFIISGYVVTRSLLRRKMHPFAFLTRRLFRLTPAIIAFISFSAFVLLLISADRHRESAVSLGMVGTQDFFLQSLATLMGCLINFVARPLYYFSAMWSLSVEYQFYAAYAVLIAVLSLFISNFHRLKQAIFAFFVAVLVTMYFQKFNILQLIIGGSQVNVLLNYLITWRFEFLAWGAVLAYASDRYGPLEFYSRRWPITIGTAALLTVLTVGMFSESPLGAVKPLHDQLLLPLAALLFTVMVALASAAIQAPAPHKTKFEAALLWLGDRSYSMYLYHFPVMALIWYLVRLWAPWLFYVGPFWYGLVQAAMTLFMTIMLADLTYRYVELPWNEVGERLSDRMTTAKQPLPTSS